MDNWGDRMRAVWLRVRAGLRQDWRGWVVLALITGLMGGVVLVALAGARRTDTAVSRFVQYAGPTEGEVDATPRTMDKIAALPSVAYSGRAALMFAVPVTAVTYVFETMLAGWVLKEHVNPTRWAGACLVIGGVVLVSL